MASSTKLTTDSVWGTDEHFTSIDAEIKNWTSQQVFYICFCSLNVSQLSLRLEMCEQNIKIMTGDVKRLTLDQKAKKELLAENEEKVKMNKQLPYLVSNVVEVVFCRKVF